MIMFHSKCIATEMHSEMHSWILKEDLNVKNRSADGLLQSGDKPIPDPTLTEINVQHTP